ncbi:MAG: hypothetical protein KKA62_01030 [Nanoarchaeota archaeon]|nr:hypothetical protein [Nanoarchaeota archaeon]MBU1976518.1 hypothetical protein [Nanoarchaeota archaeon]
MTDVNLEERLENWVNSPVDQDGLNRSFYGMLEILDPLRNEENYGELLSFVYQRVTRVFDTDEEASPLFYRADYMLALLGRLIEGEVKVSENSATVMKHSFYEMKKRHDCKDRLPYEEILEGI